MNRTVVTTTANILESLPGEDGIVNPPTLGAFSDGTAMRDIEFNGFTVWYATDTDNNDIEEAFAVLISKGAGLLKFLLKNYVESEVKTEELLRAFQIVFNLLQQQKMELESQIDKADEEDTTTGENNE